MPPRRLYASQTFFARGFVVAEIQQRIELRIVHPHEIQSPVPRLRLQPVVGHALEFLAGQRHAGLVVADVLLELDRSFVSSISSS